MSWLQWFATVLVLFGFTLLWVGGIRYLIEAAAKSAMSVLDFYLLRKREILLALEKDLGDDEAPVAKKFGSN